MLKSGKQKRLLHSPQSLLKTWRFLTGVMVVFFWQALSASEVMPPPPAHYFNDYANVVSRSAAARLDSQLESFEKSTSNQIVVAIFPKMQTDSSIEDYSQRIFTNWKVGQKGRNNGAILFVFVQEHKMRIQTGYGLEGALPDVTCKRIIEDEIAPRLRQNDYDGGLTAGVNAMMAATRGEYKPIKHNDALPDKLIPVFIFILFIILIVFLSKLSGGRGGTVYGSSGW